MTIADPAMQGPLDNKIDNRLTDILILNFARRSILLFYYYGLF